MKFYHLSLTPLTDKRSILVPHTPFENPRYKNKHYTPIFTTTHAACRHRYPDVFDTIIEKGYATGYLYEMHLSKDDIATLITPEVMTLDGHRYFDSALLEMGKHHQSLEMCCLTLSKEAVYVGEVNIFESPEWNKPKGVLGHPYPAVIDYYVVVNRMGDDKSGFVTKKTFSQVSTEIRHISPGYEDLCIQFRQLGNGEDVIPLVLQRGQHEIYTDSYGDIKRRYSPPCISFILTDRGETLLRQYQVILNKVLVDYGFVPEMLYVIKSTGRFSRHTEDYYARDRYRHTCDYSTSLISFVYRDSHITKDEEKLDSLKEAYELALLMLID